MKALRLPFTAGYRGLLLLLGLLAASLTTLAQAPAWQTAIATGTGAPTVEATTTDASGNIFISGSFTGTVSFGTATLTSAGGTDIFVAKWSAATNSFAWAQRAGGPNFDGGYSDIAVSGSSIYIIGSSSSPITFGSTTFAFTRLSGYIVKLTDAGTSGSFTWAQSITGNTGEAIYASAIAVSGTSVYVAGDASGSTMHFGPLSLTIASGDDAFVAKLTDAGSSGSFVWARRAGGTLPNDQTFFNRMAVLGNAVYLSGSMAGSAIFGGTTLTSSSGSNFDLVVAKLTDAGTTASFSWGLKGSGPGTDFVNRLAVSGSSVYAIGYFNGASFTFGSTVLTNAGTGADAFIVKVADAGTTASASWAQRVGGTGTDNINGLVVSGSAVYVAGFFTGTGSFGATSLTSAGSTDVFVAKLTDAGSSSSFAWTQQAGGISGDGATALALSGTTLYTLGTVTPPATFGSLAIATPVGTVTGFIASLAGNALATQPARATQNALGLYPNPAHTAATVRLPAGETVLSVTDARGRQVRSYAFRPGTTAASLDLRGLPAGLYLLRTATASQKLLVE